MQTPQIRLSWHFIFIYHQKGGSILTKPVSELNIIALHLGSDASASAIKNGRSYDTSMGLTPLAGLPGATRSGSIDPSLVFHFQGASGLGPSSTKDMHITTAEEVLNKKSGWKALTGITDFGKVSASKDPKCNLAFDLFVNRILAFVGSYYVTLSGKVDALVFAGGIGEIGSRLRKAATHGVECLGFAFDEEANESKVDDTVVDITK